MVRLTDRPDMTLDVYRGRKTTMQQQQQQQIQMFPKSVTKHNFEKNYTLIMYNIGIKDALYFAVIAMVVLEIFSKMECFLDQKPLVCFVVTQ